MKNIYFACDDINNKNIVKSNKYIIFWGRHGHLDSIPNIALISPPDLSSPSLATRD